MNTLVENFMYKMYFSESTSRCQGHGNSFSPKIQPVTPDVIFIDDQKQGCLGPSRIAAERKLQCHRETPIKLLPPSCSKFIESLCVLLVRFIAKPSPQEKESRKTFVLGPRLRSGPWERSQRRCGQQQEWREI